MMAPDSRRVKEKRAHYLWSEAMERMEKVFEEKGLIPQESWVRRLQPVSDRHDYAFPEMRA